MSSPTATSIREAKTMEIETFGVERIPDHARTATPYDLFRIMFGGSITFASALLGSFPVIFGLSFWASVISIVAGVLVGSILLAPMGIFGPLNGTNNPVSSGAHFGVHGRIVGSFLALLTAVAFFSMSVWSSGDALIGASRRLMGTSDSNLNYAVSYGAFALVALIVCIYGFRLMLLINRIAVPIAMLMFAVSIGAFWTPFDFHYQGTLHFGHKGFWAAFIGSALVAMSSPISYGSMLGDWARYIPSATSKLKIMSTVIWSQVATLVPLLFGTATATIVAIHAPQYITNNDYVGGLLAITPTWFLLPVCIIAILGGLATGTGCLYGTGLDMSSVFPNLLSRVRATVLIGIFAICLIFAGRFVASVIQGVTTFSVLIVTCTSPWMMIMVIGLIKRRGKYDPDDLQVYTRGLKGGRYWFHHGWNWRAMSAWVPSAIIGITFVNIPDQFVGPLGNLFDGVDVSLLVTLGLSAVSYLILEMIFPENDDVYIK